MRHALLATLVIGTVVAGCSSSDDRTATPTPESSSLSTAPPVQGPTGPGTIPTGAFMAPADLGQGWTATTPAVPPCPPSYARTAIRSTGLAEARGVLTETLATGVDITAAVAAWGRSLRACGFAVDDDPLGDAGLTAGMAGDSLVVTGTEGVLVIIHAHGRLAEARGEIADWADLAFGTSCVAAPDGCH